MNDVAPALEQLGGSPSTELAGSTALTELSYYLVWVFFFFPFPPVPVLMLTEVMETNLLLV